MNNLFLILITLVFSAFFSGMEIAFIASNKLRLELDKRQRLFSSRFVNVFSSNPSQYITTMLVGNNIALVIYGIIMAIQLEPLIQKYITSELAILIIQTILSTLIILFFAEFLPKTLVIINPNFVLNLLAFPGIIFFVVLYPFTRLIVLFSNFLLKKFLKFQETEDHKNLVFSKVDLDHLINEGAEEISENGLEEDEIKLFQNALEFSNVKVRDCMIPRTEIIAVEQSSSIKELKEKFIETGFSKILIFKEDFDNIIGYVTSKELFKNPKDIESRLISTSFVPETMAVNKLLRQLIQERKSMAVVVDEFGGVSGMITIEDIIEEIFGEIEDEHDTSKLVVKQIKTNEFLISGRVEIDYINEHFNLNIPESEEYDTLAGYIFFKYESIPKINERIAIDDYEFKILKVSDTRIELVHVFKYVEEN